MFKLTLRELLLVITLAAGVLGWWLDREQLATELAASNSSKAAEAKHAQARMNALDDAINRAGLQVKWAVYDYQNPLPLRPAKREWVTVFRDDDPLRHSVMVAQDE